MLRHRVGVDSLYDIWPPKRQTCPSSCFVRCAFVSFVVSPLNGFTKKGQHTNFPVSFVNADQQTLDHT